MTEASFFIAVLLVLIRRTDQKTDGRIVFIRYVLCLRTGPQPFPKPVLHTVRSSASSLNCVQADINGCKLKTGTRGQKATLTRMSPLRRRRFALDSSTMQEEEEEEKKNLAFFFHSRTV
jgi:hypothetical protein